MFTVKKTQIDPMRLLMWGGIAFLGFKAFGSVVKPLLGGFEGVGDAVTEKTIQKQTGATSQQATRAIRIATDVYKAFNIGGMDEDEGAVVDALSQCQDAMEVRAVCQVYSNKYNRSLKADYEKYVGWWTYFGMESLPAYVKANWF